MLEIMREKEKAVAEIFDNVEKKLEQILSEEFKDFDVVKVTSHALHDMLELQKDGKQVKIHLASKRYKRKRDTEHGTGLYFKRTRLNECDFDEKEFKEIQIRLQALYEK